MRKIIVITGQTATGKTKLALKIAKEKGGELVNADSRQVYKYLDIITGKDSIKIHLYDVIDPKEHFSSYNYKKLALDVINNTISKNKIPIVVGGTYLYIKHLLYGFDTEKIVPNWNLRKRLNKKSVFELQTMLKKLNCQSFENMNKSDQFNSRRLIRKIEIGRSNRKISTSKVENSRLKSLKPNKIQIIQFTGLKFAEKSALEKAIFKRIEKRLKMGAIDEVKNLLKRGYKKTDPGLMTIGYKQLIEYLDGNLSIEEAIKKWITAEVQYARRQYTFMKKDKNIRWIDV